MDSISVCWYDKHFITIRRSNERFVQDKSGGSIKKTSALKQISKKTLETVRKDKRDVRTGEEQHRSLYASMNESFAVHEIVFDALGKAQDYRILDVNPAFERITGIPHERAIGALASELYGIDRPPYLDVYSKVAATGEPVSFDAHFPPMDKHFIISVFSPEKNRFATVATDITDRKKAEEALLSKTEELDRYFSNSRDLLCIANTEGVFLRLNPEWERILGYKLSGLEGHRFIDFVHPEDHAAIMEALNRLTTQDEVLNFENRFRCKDGSYRWLEWRSYPSGNMIYAAARDITEQNRAAETLKESAEKYRALVETTNTGYVILDHNGNVLDANREYIRLTGHQELDEIRGRNVMEWTAQHDADRNGREIIKCFKQGFIRDLQIDYSDKANRVIPIEINATVIETGTGPQIVTLCRDITERKLAEEDLRKSEEKFKKMFEGSPIGIVMTGTDFRFIRANAAFCNMLGYTEQELISLTFKDITHPEHLVEDMRQVNELVSGKIQFYQTEKRYIRKDKTIAWGSSIVNIVRDRDNRFLYSLTTVEDITQRKLSEAERTRLELQLSQARKMEAMGTLAAGIAHDFNNILTALLGYATLLKMRIKDATLHTFVDHILSASYKATDLVQNLLAFSKQQATNLKPISLHSVIRGTEKLLKRLVTEDVTIKILLNNEDITIMADATQIDQILFNLVANARDAMPQGGILTIETKTVELSDQFQRIHGYGEPGRYALLCISDTGVGIEETTREKIFDPFFTTKEIGKGTGLGLSTVYGIVQQHNGHITVYSEPNRGTTFHIYLPVAHKTGKEENPLSSFIKGGNETILIAEDNDAVRELVGKVLIEYGYTIVEAIDGAEAVEQFKKTDKIDLLVLDSIMPNKSGREAYNEIREIKPDIKVIFTSGYTRDVFLDKGIEDKKFHFLQKPVSPDNLLQKVRDVLDNKQDSH
jgi:two-component system, cell cycle sensor histidine kinase and response regulator CckA